MYTCFLYIVNYCIRSYTQVIIVCTITSIGYGDLSISGGSNYGRLEFRQNNDTWGIACRTGFNANAALVASM